jgi:asparagine synthase (glutamine-hydrolysing)
MCGITGIFAFNLVGKFNKIHVTQATMSLNRRGPDFQDIYVDEWVGLGHRRLSIIDTSNVSNQPMWDDNGRYCIVFNGEIFNYRDLRSSLIQKGVTFFSQGDTEVLLKLYIAEGAACLSRLNGFFSFCIYDKHEQSFFVARDRFGIKPLLYAFDDDKFIFASEMKSVIQYGIDRSIDYNALFTYLQLNYIPAPSTIFGAVKKLLPGHYVKVSRQRLQLERYYTIPYNRDKADHNSISYESAKRELSTLLDASVKRRLVADVPVGTFLSGGIDSSIVTGLAAKHKADLHTFSIGFRDEKYFDETNYANLVARHFRTNHTVFSLSNDDLYANVHSILDYMDEPFADSSAIAVYILSKETRKHATVALSGDGADELLAGYNKHAAAYRMLHPGWKEHAVTAMHQVWSMLPTSRNSFSGNLARQLLRFSEGSRLSSRERYWRWAGFAKQEHAKALLSEDKRHLINEGYLSLKDSLVASIPERETINDILFADLNLVLPNDMLTKVDLMSMAASLEVRVPFLDYEVVNFVAGLPDHYKIDRSLRKKVLQDAFREMLPTQLYNRPKKGFEVPLLKWLRREMRSMIQDDLLSQKMIESQGIFEYSEVEKLKLQLFSANPGDVHARIWGLVVFQWWWKKFSGGAN